MNKILSIGINGLKDTHIEGLRKVAGDSIVIEEIDLEKEIDDRYDLIVHKPVKYIAKKMMTGNEQKQLTRLENLEANKPTVLLDPLRSIKVLCDRNELSDLLKEFSLTTEHGSMKSPSYVSARNREELDELIKNGFPLKFPVICKPFVGDGNDFSHQCAFAHNEKGLYNMTLPAIFQQFHDHDAVIYKIYVLGDEISQIQRPSLENYRTDIPHPDFELFGRISNARENGSQAIVAEKLPSEQLLKDAIKQLRSVLPMTFFGFDLIYNAETECYYIIDINYLPGYYDVKNLYSRILNYLLRAIKDRN